MSAQQFVIPSIFTAMDRLSGPLRKMSANMHDFGKAAESSLSKIDRQMRPIGRQAFLMGSAIVAPLALAVNEASKFETALASFRTIVSDLSDKDFAKYENAIKDVGSQTKKTYTEVAQSFEKIAGLNASFADTAEGISAVSKASITLARGSGMELGAAAESLVGIMNQFSMGALEADRAINVLAAGQSVGAATIQQTAEAFVNFGSVASGANITLEQSVGLIQTLGKFSVFGSEAGTKLRGSILRLQKAGLGYKSGQFAINDAMDQANKRLNTLKTAKQRDAYLNKLFGAENIATGRILLSNIGIYKEFTDGVTGTTEAHRAAEINQKTFAERLKAAKAQALNLAVNVGEKLLPVLTDLADKVIPVIEKMVRWTSNNPETVKTIIKVALAVAGLSYGVAALSGVLSLAVKIIGIYNAVTKVAAFSVLPFWILGIGALTYAVYRLVKGYSSLSTAEKLANEVRQKALDNTIDQRVEVTTLFSALRRATVGTQQYKDILTKIDALQPGITKQYNLQAGALQDINRAEMALTDSIMKRAMAEARAELLKEKTKKLLEDMESGPSTMDFIKGFFTGNGNAQLGAMQQFNKRTLDTKSQINMLADQISADGSKEAVNSKSSNYDAMMQRIEQTNHAKLDVIVHDKKGDTQVSSSNPSLNIRNTPTFGWGT